MTRRSHLEKAVHVCPQCEGEGEHADGVDDAACSTQCVRCDGNGWLVDLAILSQTFEAGEAHPSNEELEAFAVAAIPILKTEQTHPEVGLARGSLRRGFKVGWNSALTHPALSTLSFDAAELREERDILRGLVAKYGDRVRMANAAEHQSIIDAAFGKAR